jgi:flagellin
MPSILTNSSALTALQNLSATQKNLSTVQSQISTGLKVSTAKDDAAAWSISTQMKGDQASLGAISNALSTSSATLDVAITGVNKLIEVATKMKDLMSAAMQSGSDVSKIGTQYDQLGQELTSIIDSSSFNGTNLLDASFASGAVTGTTYDTASSYAGGTVSLISLDTTKTDAATSVGNIATLLSSASTFADGTQANLDLINTALDELGVMAATIGAVASRIDTQKTMVTAVNDALSNGISTLVDADMNAASARLNALQTQQQLGVQSLSIANQNSQMILKLFQ